MKTLIAGSRDIQDYTILQAAIKDSGFKITKVISGGARGVDTLAIRWAIQNQIDCIIRPAKWDIWGKKAGYVRNTFMVGEASQVITIWDGKSKGTKHIIDIVKEQNKKLFIYKPVKE